jgi:hypothetical protein
MESKDKLVVRFFDERDGAGKLWVSASSKGFSGEGSAWISTEELKDFAEALSGFPLLAHRPPTIRGGFGSSDLNNEISQEHVALKVYPVDQIGHLGLQVRVPTEVWPHDRTDAQHRVQLEIRTSYQPLTEFSRMLKAVIVGKVKEAVLMADVESQPAD